MSKKDRICIVSCSVLRQEIEKLVNQGSIDADLVFVSKYFHVEYELIEKNLRPVLEKTLSRYPGKVILVYGDLCLGQDNEMKKLAEEYGVVKVDALNCIDCQLGGKGKFNEADPEHNIMFMGPGMIDFFKHAKEKMLKEGMDEEAFKGLFSGIKGIVLLDTCGDAEKCVEELKKSGLGLEIIETRQIGVENVRLVIQKAIERNKQKK
jgi:hypothetical protein